MSNCQSLPIHFEYVALASVVGQTVWQSSTEGYAVASRAIDGRPGGHVNECTLTQPELRAWWSVGMGGRKKVHGVVIFTRNDETGTLLRQEKKICINSTYQDC